MKGSTLPFDVIFSIGLIIILFIGAAIVIHMLVPYLGSNVACIDGQKANIKEINDTIENVKFNGITQIMKFKIESCVMCAGFDNVNNQLNIRWVGQGVKDKPESFGIAETWNGFGEKIVENEECDTNHLAGGQWCTFEITPEKVDVVSGCDKPYSG